MRTIRIKLYKFNELSEQAQQKALESLYDLNVDTDWWEFIYSDAEDIGLKINEFDMDHYCKGEFIDNADKVTNKILSEHGEMCETYKTAKNYLKEIADIKQRAKEAYKEECDELDGSPTFDDFFDDNYLEEIEETDEDFKNSLLEDYRIILRNEYEYMTSEEAIKETIEANEYEFTKDGKLN